MDRQIELDAIGEGKERWAVEVKWCNKRAGIIELEKLLGNAQAQAASGCFFPGQTFLPMLFNMPFRMVFSYR